MSFGKHVFSLAMAAASLPARLRCRPFFPDSTTRVLGIKCPAPDVPWLTAAAPNA